MGFFEQDGAGLGGKVETAANHHPGQIVLIRPDNRLFDPVRNAAGRLGIHVEFGGLLGRAPIIPVREYSSAEFVNRGGRIPAPLHSLRN